MSDHTELQSPIEGIDRAGNPALPAAELSAEATHTMLGSLNKAMALLLEAELEAERSIPPPSLLPAQG